ncbi:MAG: hypothetical protein ACE5HD_04130 [Acidobacteriota bacterium]
MKVQRREINYPDLLWRRRWLIAPFVILGLIGSVVAFAKMTRLYRAGATVGMAPQTISNKIYARSGVREGARMRLIKQETSEPGYRETVAARLKAETGEAPDPGSLASWFEVVQVDRETFLFTCIDRDPRRAAACANVFADTFVERNRNRKLEETTGSGHFLQDEIARLTVELNNARAKLAAFKSEHKGELPSDREPHRAEQTFLRTQMAELDQRIENREKDREKRLAMLHGANGGSVTEGEIGQFGLNDPRVAQVRKLRDELAQARLRYTDRHPQVVRLQASLDLLMKEIRDHPPVPERDMAETSKTPEPPVPSTPGDDSLGRFLALEITGIDEEIADLQAARSKAAARFKTLEAQVQASYDNETEVSQMKATISLFEKRLLDNQSRQQSLETEREVLERGMDERFVVKSAASVPGLPFRPDLLQLLAIGLGAGLALGVGLALLLELLDSRVRSAEEIEELLPVEVLATIPVLNRSPRRSGEKGTRNGRRRRAGSSRD